MTTLADFRREKDQQFGTDRQSPLTPEQKRTFTGLTYYPQNPALCLELRLERTAAPQPVTLATSTGEQREYLHAGQIRFTIAGEEALLQVYEADYGFFLPFSDPTAPLETYGAGRYLEPLKTSPDTLLVDFNLAYNPYCAYNERWSCPLPPSANRLKVKVEAGEKKFHD